MRLTLTLLGHTLDLSLETTVTESGNSLDGGYTSAYPVGFTQQATEPPMWIAPDRTQPWDEPDE